MVVLSNALKWILLNRRKGFIKMAYTENEKKEIIQAVYEFRENHSEEAAQILYMAGYKKAYTEARICLSRKQHTDDDGAKDVAQNVMVAVFKGIDNLQTPEFYLSWVQGITDNQLKKIYVKRDKQRENEVSIEDLSTEDKDGENIEFDLEDKSLNSRHDLAFDQKEKVKIIDEILGSLSEKNLRVIILHYFKKMSIQQIADELGIEKSTAMGRLQHARNDLKLAITNYQKTYDIKLYNVAPIAFFMWLIRGGIDENAYYESFGYMPEHGFEEATSSMIHSAGKPDVKASVAEKEPASTSKANIEKQIINNTKTAPISMATKGNVGASLATKVAVGAAIAVAGIGGGYILKQNLSKDHQAISEPVSEKEIVDNTEMSTASSENTEEKIKIPAEAGESNIIYVNLPDGWTGRNETLHSYKGAMGENVDLQVYAIYSGKPGDKTKPFAIISSVDTSEVCGGIGGEQPQIPDELVFSEDGRIISGPINLMDTQYPVTEKFDGIADNEYCYLYRLFTTDFVIKGVNYELLYFPKADDTKLDAINNIYESFKPTMLGEVTIDTANVDAITAYYLPSTSSDIAYTVKVNPSNNLYYAVLQKIEDNNLTWYRVGSNIWIPDDNQGKMIFDPLEQD